MNARGCWFNVWHSEEKNHTITSIDAEKVFDKIQNLLEKKKNSPRKL